jgi:hypothetical protein
MSSGDDYVAMFRGGAEHRFDREGHLTRTIDLDGNATTLAWTHDADGSNPRLTAIRALSDGAFLAAGATAQREIAVTSPTSSTLRFTEELGSTTSSTGRYTKFAKDGADDLVSVVPARRSTTCAGSGPSGCLKLAYDPRRRRCHCRASAAPGCDRTAGGRAHDVRSGARGVGPNPGRPVGARLRVRWRRRRFGQVLGGV